MVGHPKHVPKALAVGVDIICAQGGEGGGHTGDVPFSILIPACVDACKGKVSPLTGKPISVIAAGGISDGRGLAASLMYGADAVWVGTRFVAATEAGAPKRHKELVVSAGFGDARRTLIYSGRPMRVRYTDYVKDWEENRQEEIKQLCDQGIVPHDDYMEKHPEVGAKGMKWREYPPRNRRHLSWTRADRQSWARSRLSSARLSPQRRLSTRWCRPPCAASRPGRPTSAPAAARACKRPVTQ